MNAHPLIRLRHLLPRAGGEGTSAVDRHARHIDPAFVRLLGVLGYGRVFTRAEDVYVWDEQDRRYLDLLAGFGSVNIGHNHPRLIRRLKAFLDEHPLNLNHTGISPHAAQLAEELARITSLDRVIFSNSGAEAVEAAMKLARAATERPRILFCERAFHGLSFGTLSVSATKRMREPYEPLLPECTAIPFGDLDALHREVVKNDVALFLVEPIQIEGGLHFPPAGYLKSAREICAKHGVLFALDEVQTGFGRTGSMFAFEQEDVKPDILILAKSAGGSIAPIGLTMTTPAIHKSSFASTFAGNAFACAAALETLRILDDEDLVARSRQLGEEFLAMLRVRLEGHPLVKEIRGRGLLIAIELRRVAKTIAGQWLALALLERGVILQPASEAWDVLRIEPPLTITSAQVHDAVEAIGAVFDEHRSTATLLAKASRRVLAQLLRGGKFR